MSWPIILTGITWVPDPDHGKQVRVPDGVVIHSGEKSDRVAESAIANDNGHDVSYHFARSRKHSRIVQCVPLNRRAWHAGPEGNDWIGIGLAGPYTLDPRSVDEKLDFRSLLEKLQAAWRASFGRALRYWCRHSDITKGKRDPGPGFTSDWLDGFGLSWKRGPAGLSAPV